MVAESMPNACNSCHLEKSTQWTLTEYEKIWGRQFKRTTDWPSKEQLNKPAGKNWLNSPDSHVRLVASQLYGISNKNKPLDRSTKIKIVHSLNDTERINRVFGSFTVKKIFEFPMNQRLTVNITEAPSRRKKQIEALIIQLGLEKD